jgi:hypothetical protein
MFGDEEEDDFTPKSKRKSIEQPIEPSLSQAEQPKRKGLIFDDDEEEPQFKSKKKTEEQEPVSQPPPPKVSPLQEEAPRNVAPLLPASKKKGIFDDG